MPEIKRFGDFKLLMFFRTRTRHTSTSGCADFAAKIRIADGELLSGDAPSGVLRRARRWVERIARGTSSRGDPHARRGDEGDESASDGRRVRHVRFAGERRDRKLDLTGLIARSVHFAPL